MVSMIQRLGNRLYDGYFAVCEVHPGMALNHLQIVLITRFPIVMAWGAQMMGSLPLKPLVATATLADAVFHHVSEYNMKYFEKAAHNKGVLCLTRFAVLAWSTGYLFQELAEKTTVFPLSLESVVTIYWAKGLLSWPLLIGAVATGAFVAITLNKWSRAYRKVDLEELAKTDEALQKNLKEANVSWKKPNSHFTDQLIAVFQQVTYVSLAIFSKSKLIFAGLSALNLYTLYQMTRRDWLTITREVYQSIHEKNIKFKYEAIFLPKKQEEENEKCTICLEVPKKAYYICPNPNHTHCMSCLAQIFIKATENFRIVNTCTRIADDKKITYKVYADRNILPRCIQRCGDIASQNQLHIQIEDLIVGWSSADITWLEDYTPGKEIHVKIQKFDLRNSTAIGQLEDGTVVWFANVQNNAAIELIQTKKEIKAQIISKTVESEMVELKCSSADLPEQENQIPSEESSSDESSESEFRQSFDDWSQKHPIGKPIQVILEGFDEYEKRFFGHLASGELVHFYGTASIGDIVHGYIFNHGFTEQLIQVEEDVMRFHRSFFLDCSFYQQQQTVEFTLSSIDSHPLYYIGNLEDGTKVKFYPDPEETEVTYKIGKKCTSLVQHIEEDKGNILLTCYPGNYDPDIELSSSSSSIN